MSSVAFLEHKLQTARRRARVRTYAGQPIAPIVERLHSAQSTAHSAPGQAGPPYAPCPVLCAGSKKLAMLRAWVCAVDPRGHAVLCALFGPDAGARLANGSIEIPARLCDALVELMANLPMAIAPDGAA